MTTPKLKTGSNPLCFRCGCSHHKNEYCRAKGKTCFTCHGSNHFNTQCHYFQLDSKSNISKENSSMIDDMKRTIDKLREITWCSECLELGSVDKIQCVKGHLVCASHVKFYLKKCPICKLELSDKKPSIIVRQVVEALMKNCKHKNCYKSIDSETDHEEYCKFKDTDCFFNCKWKGPVNSLVKHVTETHPEQEIFGDSSEMVWAASDIMHSSETRGYTGLATLYYFDGHCIWDCSHNLNHISGLLMCFFLEPNGKPKGDIIVEIIFKSSSREHITKLKLHLDYELNEFTLPRSLIPKLVDKDGNLTYTIKFSYS